MIVESYIQKEIVATDVDEKELDEWNELVAALGMEGQAKLNGASKGVNPFPIMTTKVYNVYNTLLVNQREHTEFSEESIPLEVLKLIKYAKDENFFEQIDIWYEPTMDDPVVVGIRHRNGNKWDKAYHMIARWGEELIDYHTLEQKAIEKLKVERKQRLGEKHVEVKNALETLDIDVEAHIKQGKTLRYI